jgi:hypothetical protein
MDVNEQKPNSAPRNTGNTICRPFFFWLAVVAVICALLAGVWPSNTGRPWKVQREEQRRIVRERVEALGGWDALQLGCADLISRNGSTVSRSNLPPTIAGLHPMEVRVFTGPGGSSNVRIKFFGLYSTGAWGVPYYGLWVVCGSTNPPKLDFGGNTVSGVIQRITNSVFEVY